MPESLPWTEEQHSTQYFNGNLVLPPETRWIYTSSPTLGSPCPILFETVPRAVQVGWPKTFSRSMQAINNVTSHPKAKFCIFPCTDVGTEPKGAR